MLVVFNEQEEQFSLPLVETHTHIGRVKIETTKGTSQRVNRPPTRRRRTRLKEQTFLEMFNG